MSVRARPTTMPAGLDPRATDGTTIRRYTFRLITPMHGAGVTSKEASKPHDRVTPIRVASIRGQLRFWWRACGRVDPIQDAAHLHRLEAAIWGSTTQPSSITIRASQPRTPPRSVEVFTMDDRNRYSPADGMREVAYGAFPLKPRDGSGEHPGTLHDLSASTFSLEVRCRAEHINDIEDAIFAWALFGGLGGRTRRGFGAVELQPPATDGEADTRPLHIPVPGEFLARLAPRHTLPGLPTLVGAKLRLSGTSHRTAQSAWKSALGALQAFRQRPGLGRNPVNPATKRPGRSRWPEPDAIRSILANRGSTYAHQVLCSIRKFPRASFGLPIIFHFSTNGDPVDTTLRPQDHERLASPLILRPLAHGADYRALALILQSTAPFEPLALVPRGGQARAVQARLTATEAKQITPLRGYVDPLDAFLAHFEESAP